MRKEGKIPAGYFFGPLIVKPLYHQCPMKTSLCFLSAFLTLLLTPACEKHEIACETDAECEEMLVGYWKRTSMWMSKQRVRIFRKDGMYGKFVITTGGRTEFNEEELEEIDSIAQNELRHTFKVVDNTIITRDTSTGQELKEPIFHLTSSQLVYGNEDNEFERIQ